MSNNSEKERFIELFRECSGKKYPTQEDDMYTFYLSLCFIKEAVEQADASIKLDFSDEEAKEMTYRKHVDNHLNELERGIQNYVCEVKGFENVKYYFEWLAGMNGVFKNKTGWEEKAKQYVSKIHSFVFQK